MQKIVQGSCKDRARIVQGSCKDHARRSCTILNFTWWALFHIFTFFSFDQIAIATANVFVDTWWTITLASFSSNSL